MPGKKDPRERNHVLSLKERRHEMMVIGVCVGVCLLFFLKILFF